jgi:hypothetical protein
MSDTDLIHGKRIEKAIYLIRGEKVMLDRDLALLYGVETKVLNRAVKKISSDFRRISCFNLLQMKEIF